ncbi:heavy-metal-associated domain-containing protein [Niabella insulamsoli]|uniref:heavy-metal-associated domain-containing protein n=1 Tax=Niabella insulamsoli TaxID=3144874 RepID=UPI0031FCFC81
MENKELKFKTNINCSGCVAAVKPHLDQATGVDHWKVDTVHKDKILTVNAADISADKVIKTVENAGYKIEAI